MTTIAGIPDPVPSGDGGPASAAAVKPMAITFTGNSLFILEDKAIIRQIDFATGTISRVAGTGEVSNTGDGGPALSARCAPTRSGATGHSVYRR